ncbi:thymidylate kinase-like [Mercenaria mercenaria]|uniref:thymidylate kinase-like n=1 Tax=Mercenaria mercenaria TaxID=6596 RepID=UPI00234E55BB|nr:thymidylate kinase-like [Mercenaria mercenaria]
MLRNFILVNKRLLHLISGAETLNRARISKRYIKMEKRHGIQEVCQRGALIVFEGVDRSGKTTQCNLLEERLNRDSGNVKLLKFPDRTTVIGEMINDYLGCKKDVEDHAVHLLFSANRWERVPMMLELLNKGTTLIVDRYAYSGVAFTAAKPGFNIDWCKQPDIGLPRPDTVLYLTLSSEAAAKRGGFGEERYEQTDFQKTVAGNFELLKDKSWQVIDADKSVDDLHRELLDICSKTIQDVGDKPIYKLWTEGKYVL